MNTHHAHKCKSEVFRYDVAKLVDAARVLTSDDRDMVLRRLVDRYTWTELAEADTGWDKTGARTFGTTPVRIRTRFKKAVELICLWLDARHGRGHLRPRRSKPVAFGLFNKRNVCT